MRKICIGALLLFLVLSVAPISYAGSGEFFDMAVTSYVTDGYKYEYKVFYPSYTYDPSEMRGISHWWLEVNCAHLSIDEETIYGYTTIGGVQYDWDVEFGDNKGQVGDYTDWVIKWETPNWETLDIEIIEIPKDPDTLIGTFGFHSFQPPTMGNWGGNGAGDFVNGEIQVPLSLNDCAPVPEPGTLLLFGAGALGLGIFKKKRRLCVGNCVNRRKI